MLLDAIQDKNLHLSKRRCSLKACLWCKGFSFYGWTGDYFAALLARSLSTLSLFPLPSPPRCLADGLSAPPPLLPHPPPLSIRTFYLEPFADHTFTQTRGVAFNARQAQAFPIQPGTALDSSQPWENGRSRKRFILTSEKKLQKECYPQIEKLIRLQCRVWDILGFNGAREQRISKM